MTARRHGRRIVLRVATASGLKAAATTPRPHARSRRDGTSAGTRSAPAWLLHPDGSGTRQPARRSESVLLIRPAGALRSRGEWPIPRDIDDAGAPTVGDRVAGGGRRVDAFPAMSAAPRTGWRLRPARERVPRLAEAVDAFLAQPDLAPSSRRSYAQTLGRLRDYAGADRSLDRLSAREL